MKIDLQTFRVTPYDFVQIIRTSYGTIKYSNVHELVQGGPEIVNILFDDISYFSNKFFGGPVLIDNEMVYLPVFTKSWLNTGFKLASINLKDRKLKVFGKRYQLILLKKIHQDNLYFYTDLKNNIEIKRKIKK